MTVVVAAVVIMVLLPAMAVAVAVRAAGLVGSGERLEERAVEGSSAAGLALRTVRPREREQDTFGGSDRRRPRHVFAQHRHRERCHDDRGDRRDDDRPCRNH
jgi:hypothetical protein